jgi:hypothetical protein
MRLSEWPIVPALLAACCGVGGCYADHTWVDVPDASDDSAAPTLDPCGIPDFITSAVYSIQAGTILCGDYGPRTEHWVYSPSHGRCGPYYCDCPDPECTWDDRPIYGCIFGEDEDGGEHRGDFPRDYCLFTTREECECRCTGTC